MKFIAIVSLSACIFPNQAMAFKFLKKSKILAEENVIAYSGEVHKDKNELVLAKQFQNIQTHALYQATKSGKKLIDRKFGVGESRRDCGNPEKGISIPIDPKSSPIIFQSPPEKLKLNWINGSNIQFFAPPNCLKHLYKNPDNKIDYFTVGGPEGTSFYIARTFEKKTKEQSEKNCTGGSSYGKKFIHQNCFQKDLKSPQAVIQIGYFSEKHSKCSNKLLYKALVDIDGYKTLVDIDGDKALVDIDGGNGAVASIKEFLGRLDIESGKKKEKWLILNSPGYEGDGILAIPFSEFLKGNVKNHEWVVYNGC